MSAAPAVATENPTEEIHARHPEILDTLGEFYAGFGSAATDDERRHELRGLVAFLRQGIYPFARREERVIDRAEREAVAFEHAFLAAEVEELARLAQEAADDPEPARLHRHLHRIEAVLELHAQRLEEAPEGPVATDRETVDAPCESATEVREMLRGEALDFLRSHRWGVLATAEPGGPYAVPVSYGMCGEDVVLACGPGRKMRNLELNPELRLTVVDVASGDRWRSVVVRGRMASITDPLELVRGLRALRPRGAPPSARDLARAVRARVGRIAVTEISGRSRG